MYISDLKMRGMHYLAHFFCQSKYFGNILLKYYCSALLFSTTSEMQQWKISFKISPMWLLNNSKLRLAEQNIKPTDLKGSVANGSGVISVPLYVNKNQSNSCSRSY